jgi:hypothetical protein
MLQPRVVTGVRRVNPRFLEAKHVGVLGWGAQGPGAEEIVHLLWAGQAMQVVRGHPQRQGWATLPQSAAPH